MTNDMSTSIQFGAIEKALIQGDLSALNDEQRLSYAQRVCDSVGLNLLTKPFEYIKLNNKLVLYATKACGEQLRKIHNLSLKVSSREILGDVYVVTADAKMPDGREDSSTGAVSVKGLVGDALANAYMKAETKAKRRVTLSICGLSMLDESEVESIASSHRDIQNVTPTSTTTPQISNDLIDAGDYVVTIGKKFKGMALKDIPINEIEGFMAWLYAEESKSGKALSGGALEFVNHAQKYLDSENSETPPDA